VGTNTVLRVTVPQIPGARVRERRTRWEVAADRVHALQQLAVAAVGTTALTELEVTLASWRPPVRGWLGSPGLPGIQTLSWEPKGSGGRLRLGMVEPVDAALLVSAAVRVLRPVPTGDTGPMLTFAPGLPPTAAALGGQVRDVLLPDEARDRHVRRADVLVVPEGSVAPEPARATTLQIGADGWIRDGRSFDVCVDPTVHRPVGRRSTGATGIATATVTGTVVTLRAEGGDTVIDGEVTAPQAASLRRIGAVVGDVLPNRVARQLTACGVLVPGAATPTPETDLDWQARSVHERRHALRQFGPTAALDAWPTVSIVLATHRPDHLLHAFGQLAGLRYPRLEVVVGAHGDQVDGARVWELARDLPFPVTVVALEGGRSLGEALQACCDRAEGTLVTKMDDDDVYGPEHVWDLVLARQYSGAQVVGKALDWVYLESQDVTVFRPVYPAEKYADFVAGGTMLISRADLAAVGGWRPVPRSVDRALIDRVRAQGGLVYRTHGLGYVYVRHSAGHTADVRDEHFLTKTAATYPGLVRHEAFGTATAPGQGGSGWPAGAGGGQ
jgi:hypothetical protein